MNEVITESIYVSHRELEPYDGGSRLLNGIEKIPTGIIPGELIIRR